MESDLAVFAAYLEELKLKREQVKQLDGDVNKISLLLVEKDSELQAKSSQCQLLETKLAKTTHDLQQVIENHSNQIKSLQLENGRLEETVADYNEKLRIIQMEKQCQTLKVTHLEKQIKEIFEHGRSMRISLTQATTQQSHLLESLEAFEQRQNKILETCEEIQNRTSQILKEATDKWRLARAMHAQQADLERKICAVEARAQKLESVGTEDVAAVREQNESLHHQLELSMQREVKLRQDLQRERQYKLIQECRMEELLAKMVHSTSASIGQGTQLSS